VCPVELGRVTADVPLRVVPLCAGVTLARPEPVTWLLVMLAAQEHAEGSESRLALTLPLLEPVDLNLDVGDSAELQFQLAAVRSGHLLDLGDTPQHVVFPARCLPAFPLSLRVRLLRHPV